jgi:uncharacterized protein with PIN domain
VWRVVDQCPECNGRRLRATREERDHTAGGVLFTGFVKVTVCKTCRAVFKDEAEEAAFIAEVEQVATSALPEGEEPRKIRRRR